MQKVKGKRFTGAITPDFHTLSHENPGQEHSRVPKTQAFY